MKNEADEAPTTLPVPVGISASKLVHLADPWIAAAVVALLALGTVLVYSATAVRSANAGDGEAYLFRHLGSVAVGLVLMAAAMRLPLEAWSRFAYPLLAISVALLILVYVPGVGRRVNGALRWVQLGPISFQPGELAKLAVVVYLAHSLAKKREKVSTFSVGFLPHVLVTSLVVLLVLAQPDIGTSAVIYACLGVMLFVAGTRVGYLVLAVVAALPVALHYVTSRPHAMRRLLVFLDPEPHKQGSGYQIWESLVSFGSGGPFGLGLGAGKQKLYFLPESHTDFVYAVLGQELGFLGAVFAIVCFGVIVGRGMAAASKMPCRFPMFLAFGLSAWIGMQAAVNMAVVTALVPTKGLTLPLVSYGRSSMLITMLAMGVLLRATAEYRALSPVRIPKRSRSREVMA